MHQMLPPWMLEGAFKAYEATRPGRPMRYIVAGVAMWALIETFPGE